MPWIGHRMGFGERGKQARVVVTCACGWQREPDPNRPSNEVWLEHLSKSRATFRHSMDSLDDIEVQVDHDAGVAVLNCACGWRGTVNGSGAALANNIFAARRGHAQTGR